MASTNIDPMTSIPESTAINPTSSTSKPTTTASNTNASSSPLKNHNTGFNEPFSLERNTTLPHPSAIINPSEELATQLVSSKHNKRIPHPHLKHHGHGRKGKKEGEEVEGKEDGEEDWLNGEEEEEKEGRLKRVVQKLDCRK